LAGAFFLTTPAHAAPGINQQVNFQGRLLTSQGATVPDGYYNMEFKIYQDGDGQSVGDTTGSPAGTLKWTEDYLNTGSGQAVEVKNGFMSVQLGSITPFGSSINWNSDTLWLSMQVGNTSTCTITTNFQTDCGGDGEMTPMKRLSSTAYALNSNALGGLTSAQFLQLAQGVQTDTSAVNPSLFLNKNNSTGTPNIIELQKAGTDVLTVNNSGNLILGKSGTGGINGTLVFSTTNAANTTITLQAASTASSYALILPTSGPSTSQCLQTDSSTASQLVFGPCGANGTFLAKNATDTSSAAAGTGILYTFTNSSSASTGIVLKLDNGTNTGSTFFATTSGNPALGQAVIYAQNTNATPSGNLIDLQAGSTPSSKFSVNASGDITNASTKINTDTLSATALTFGGSGTATIQPAASQALTITGHATSTWSLDAGNLAIQTTAAASTLTLDAGTSGNGTIKIGTNANSLSLQVAASGTINVGANNAAVTVQIGSTTLSSGTQTINIGTNNTAGGTTNVTVGNGASATGGTTTLQAKGTVIFATNGITRGTFDTANDFYFGNGITAASPNNFTLSGTGSTTTAVAGGSLVIQGGNATVGSANGGNITLVGGTGIGTGTTGLVIVKTPTFSTASTQTCGVSCTITQTNVDGNGAVIVNATASALNVTLPNPTITTAGRIVYVTAANGSNDFTLLVNGGGTGNQIAMRSNTTATMIWSGSAWTAAGASSSTTLQAAYDNTLTSAGGAELVVSNGTNANGLTIRDSSTNPVAGTLFEVQSSSAAELFSVNGNVNDYASDGGAETAGGSSSTFPANTWGTVGSDTVSRYTTVGNFIATGQASVSATTSTTANDGLKNTLSSSLTANTHYNVSFAARLTSGTFTDMNVYYSVDGTTASVACTTSQAIATSVWTKVNCSFAAPASGITASNAILIRQTSSGTARTFYVDNLSVTIAADYNYATDGGVDDSTNFATNWTNVSGASVSRSTAAGNDASDSAQVITTGTGQGVRNKLSINPLQSTLYRVTVYAASTTSGFSTFTVRYSRDGGTNFVNCADYNTQTISSSLTSFTEVTCYITTDGTAATNPYVYFTQSDATGRTFYVDTFSMTLNTNTTPNVQIGGGVNGGPITLLTLDRAASAPIASNNDAFLGSMYYDTSLGKLQCYEADGWGACGSSPDNIVTISPEFTNAVMHGTGVGTMNSDICSGTLHINDGTSGQPTICAANETYNFYKWTSPQASAQTYSIYVTYQLPTTFKSFASGQTSIMGRTDSSNATVQYSVYRNDPSTGLTQCGSTVAVSTGSVSSWQTGIASGAADPSTCGFAPSNSIVFKIDVIASSNANAYVGNLNFTFSNK
jgi:hypothetical protein